MSTDTETDDEASSRPSDIALRLDEDGEWWVARDEETGVASQGKSREAALENLDEAVALYRGEIGREPTDEELKEIGIDPDANESGELPDFMR